jgi:NTP pyrophosphatase (non-canonical NTP hydrolase)
MDFNEYQRLAHRTSAEGGRWAEEDGWPLVVAVLGLNGEAGEVADTLKKQISHGHPTTRERLVDETSDCLWYIAEICTILGVTLEEVAQYNIRKLERRYPEHAFSTERSLHRDT